MNDSYHTITITVYNRDKVYKKVSELLHRYADKVALRVGYPVEGEDISIIFLILKMPLEELGSLSGKLGQIESVKVKTTSLKFDTA